MAFMSDNCIHQSLLADTPIQLGYKGTLSQDPIDLKWLKNVWNDNGQYKVCGKFPESPTVAVEDVTENAINAIMTQS